ncbi:MAG: tetratricopeptide repeat protein [Acidobacteriaceae bacterium]
MEFLTPEELHQQAEEHYYSALDLLADDKQEDAIVEFKEALELDPNFLDAMHGLTRALQDADRVDEAIAIARRLAELDPNDILAHTSLSILYQKKGLVPEAEAEGNKARVLGWKQQLLDQKEKKDR